MSYKDISEEINQFWYSIPTEVLKKTYGVRKYLRKTRESNIYTRISGEVSTSVLEVTRKINLSDSGTLKADNYYDYDWEANYYEEVGQERDIVHEY
jgi:hypothetical protein